jgi:hypothetical protein
MTLLVSGNDSMKAKKNMDLLVLGDGVREGGRLYLAIVAPLQEVDTVHCFVLMLGGK